MCSRGLALVQCNYCLLLALMQNAHCFQHTVLQLKRLRGAAISSCLHWLPSKGDTYMILATTLSEIYLSTL